AKPNPLGCSVPLPSTIMTCGYIDEFDFSSVLSNSRIDSTSRNAKNPAIYGNDVYGISRFLKKLIKEARDEVLNVDNSDQDNGKDQSNSHPKTALERLKMVRARLLIDGRFNHAHIRDTSHLDFTDKWGYEKLPDDAIAVPLKHQPPSNDDNDDCK
ncbi:8270_t:CDS:2, partial [Entrophospora sp. SA101]